MTNQHNEPTADYPIGGELEHYDIERDREIMEEPFIRKITYTELDEQGTESKKKTAYTELDLENINQALEYKPGGKRKIKVYEIETLEGNILI